MVKKLAFHSLGVAATMIVLAGISLMYTKHRYQKEAEEFWGAAYDPEQDDLQMDLPLAFLIPHGGPTANGAYFGVCTDTPLPMVPVRVTSERDHLEALCGISDFRIESFVIEDEGLKKLFASEYVD